MVAREPREHTSGYIAYCPVNSCYGDCAVDRPGHLGPVLHSVVLVVYGGMCLLCREQGLKHTGFSGPLVSYWKLKIVEAR